MLIETPLVRLCTGARTLFLTNVFVLADGTVKPDDNVENENAMNIVIIRSNLMIYNIEYSLVNESQWMRCYVDVTI